MSLKAMCCVENDNKEQPQDGKVTLKANNDNGDPCPGIKKVLVVEFMPRHKELERRITCYRRAQRADLTM
jgi:hypothetical protein